MAKIYIQADKYFNNKKRMDMMFGDMVCPVDINAGYVCPKVDKYGMDDACGEETEQNIRERFSLETPDSEDKESEEGKNY